MTYNAVGSDFWLLTKAYSKRFEDRYRKIKNVHYCMYEWLYNSVILLYEGAVLLTLLFACACC
jgi:hypothetical protein